MSDELVLHILVSAGLFLSVAMLVRLGVPEIGRMIHRLEARFDHVLNYQLLMGIKPRHAIYGIVLAMLVAAGFTWALLGSALGAIIAAVLVLALPNAVINYLEAKRRRRLERQIVDGITSLASGVRAGLTLVQSFQLLVQNSTGPIKQEFTHLLREYELGVDLNQAMVNASNRIGSSHYRLLFAAIAAHRTRGGDVSQSLDRITDSIREIQRLEGKLQTLTAQGRNQAWMMAGMAIVVMIILYFIDSEGMTQVLMRDSGRLILLIAGLFVLAGFLWIRKIMSVDV